MGLAVRRDCRCGHDSGAHEHYRRGSDCSGCACERFHGQLQITLRLGRVRPQTAVVVPDEVHTAVEPWVRPTHSAGMPVYPPSPRRSDSPPSRVTTTKSG
jgi:hypothetical protein